MDFFGLTDIKLAKLNSVFHRYNAIDQVLIYGSRAMGTHAPFSDVDIVLVGLDITTKTLTKIIFDIEDLFFPYDFDVSILAKINNPDVINHINRVGKVLYNRAEYINSDNK